MTGRLVLVVATRWSKKPGRDPRSEFRVVRFDDAITEISDLKPGQVLEGVVTNVTAFGAFVDIGVHQDGLVHISELADTFVKDPHSVVKTGQVVNVVVLEVDASRKRIGLSMKRQGSQQAAKPGKGSKAAKRKPSDSPFGVLASLR